MQDTTQILKIVRNGLILLLLCIMGFQQWGTFLQHQDKFIHPIQFTKQNFGTDYITIYEKRFDEIKKMFPIPARLTYFGENGEDAATGSMHYSLTQYYLSPNLIFINKFYLSPDMTYKNDVVHDTIIYNLYNSIHINPATNIHLNSGWHVLKDFNNGLILLSK